MVRPGAGYRLFEAFKEASAIAPDIPKLSVPNAAAALNSHAMALQVRRGLAWRNWEQNGAENGAQPSSSLADYPDLGANDGVAHTRLKNIAFQIFEQIPAGALVFIPNPALEGKALMGIAERKGSPLVQLTRRWGNGKTLEFQGRSLSNLIEVPMRVLPEDIASLRKNRGLVVSKIADSGDATLLYREYFKTFSLANSQAYAQYRTGDHELPGGALGGLIAVMRFAMDAEPSVADGVAKAPITDRAMLIRALSPADDLLVHARVNSPFGRVTFQSMSNAIFAGAALVALAALNADAQVLNDLANRTLEVANVCTSLANDTIAARAQAVEVKETLFDFYATYGADTCEEVLVTLRRTVENTDGRVDVEAE